MEKSPSAAVLEAHKAQPIKLSPNGDKLDRLRAKALEARELQLEIAEMEERLSDKKASLQEIYHKTLPDLMDEAGVPSIGLGPLGNRPAVEAVLLPFYSANIAASWEEGRRQKAFDLLDKKGAGDLVKAQVVVSFPKGKQDDALKLMQQVLKKKGVAAEFKKTVPFQSLTAWLKEQVETYQRTPSASELEIIGGTVGRVVKLKEKKA